MRASSLVDGVGRGHLSCPLPIHSTTTPPYLAATAWQAFYFNLCLDYHRSAIQNNPKSLESTMVLLDTTDGAHKLCFSGRHGSDLAGECLRKLQTQHIFTLSDRQRSMRPTWAKVSFRIRGRTSCKRTLTTSSPGFSAWPASQSGRLLRPGEGGFYLACNDLRASAKIT
jgi:hypothetical protein